MRVDMLIQSTQKSPDIESMQAVSRRHIKRMACGHRSRHMRYRKRQRAAPSTQAQRPSSCILPQMPMQTLRARMR